MVQPMFLPMGSCEVAPEGIRAAHDGKNEPSLRVVVCFPFEPKEHDQIALQCAGAGDVSVRALDAMLGRGRELLSKDCAGGKTHRVKAGVPPEWWPGRTGWVLEIELRGSLTLCSLELAPAATPEKDKWEMIPLKAGHTVCRRRVDGVVRSWGCLSGTDGKCPLPQLERFFSGDLDGGQGEASWREFASVLDAAYSHIRRETARLAADLEAVEAARVTAEEAYVRACKNQEDLQKKMESLERTLTATEANRAKAEDAFSSAQHQLTESERNRTAAEEAYARACKDQQALQDKMESLERTLTATEANRARAEDAYSNAQLQLNESEKNRAAAEEAYAKSSAESKALSLALETLRNRLEEAECDLVQAGNRIQSLTGDLETERETRAAVESQLKEREESLAETTGSLAKTTAQRDTAETAYAHLQEQYYDLEDNLKRLEAECQSMRGIRGGTREILYVFKKRILGFRESLYQIKKKIVGWQPAEPQEWFPPNWKTLEGPPAASADRPCVLVLSHMFPHPDQPQLGSFILDQVRALRQYANMDVRVLAGRPFWMNHSKHPLMLWRFNKLYFRFLNKMCWRELNGVPVMYVPYRVIARPWTHGFSYRQAMLHAIPRVRESFPFSLVHAHTAYMDGTAGLAIAREYHVPLLITEHTGPFSNLLRGRVMTHDTTRALNSADRTIAVSSSLKRCMGEVMTPEKNAKTIVLPNGVDLDLFHPPAEHRPDPRTFRSCCAPLPWLRGTFPAPRSASWEAPRNPRTKMRSRPLPRNSDWRTRRVFWDPGAGKRWPNSCGRKRISWFFPAPPRPSAAFWPRPSLVANRWWPPAAEVPRISSRATPWGGSAKTEARGTSPAPSVRSLPRCRASPGTPYTLTPSSASDSNPFPAASPRSTTTCWRPSRICNRAPGRCSESAARIL
jgi:predicted  nucleic acid-binding Zn-ribbon protein